MPGKQIIVTICKVVMTLCLALEGVVLAGSGFPYYVHMFPGILVLGLTWLLTIVCCFFYFKNPILVILAQGMTFLINSLRLWRVDPSTHDLDWFLYMHSPELLFLLAACIGALTNRITRSEMA
jgi:hypothetical protein